MSVRPVWLVGIVATICMVIAAGILAAPTITVEPATVASAKTRADHESIARAYEGAAMRLDAEADTHARLAETYGDYRAPKLYSGEMERHCKDLARDLKASAELNRKLAALHHKIAAELSE